MHHILKKSFGTVHPEAGCDESGRGCLAGPVFAGAVILPENPDATLCAGLNDSKRLSGKERQLMKQLIKVHALAWAVAYVDNHTIDKINILNASIMAMHLALKELDPQPAIILADGNRFSPYGDTPFHCVIKGDATYLSVAAASILAKTARDEYMQKLHKQYPHYGWDQNKGYPTAVHRNAIATYGISPFHRKSFRLLTQVTLNIPSTI